MVDKEDVAAILDLIRPSLQADGGDIALVDVSEDGVFGFRGFGKVKMLALPG